VGYKLAMARSAARVSTISLIAHEAGPKFYDLMTNFNNNVMHEPYKVDKFSVAVTVGIACYCITSQAGLFAPDTIKRKFIPSMSLLRKSERVAMAGVLAGVVAGLSMPYVQDAIANTNLHGLLRDIFEPIKILGSTINDYLKTPNILGSFTNIHVAKPTNDMLRTEEGLAYGGIAYAAAVGTFKIVKEKLIVAFYVLKGYAISVRDAFKVPVDRLSGKWK
jgi:hypothetical protein